MTGATRHTRSLRVAEELLEATFPEDLGVLGTECGERISALRKEFESFAVMAQGRIASLHLEIDEWRERVFRGEKGFDAEQEAAYTEALRASISFIELLCEKWDAFSKKGIHLAKPRFITRLLPKKTQIERSMIGS